MLTVPPLLSHCICQTTSFKKGLLTFLLFVVFSTMLPANRINSSNNRFRWLSETRSKLTLTESSPGDSFSQLTTFSQNQPAVSPAATFEACTLVTTATASVSDGTGNATAIIKASGGNGTYTFTLNGLSNSTGVFIRLGGGAYRYIVKDVATGCTATGDVIVGEAISRKVNESCHDTVLRAGAGCVATLSWNDPALLFPDTISIEPWGGPERGRLIYKGTYNGHGYFLSAGAYTWADARRISKAAGGHLVTVNDAEENDFIYNHFRQQDNYGAWIGLYNTGKPGSFAWDNDEPVTYTNWNFGEPNNQGGDTGKIAEGYVHIMGFDYRNRWNDISDRLLPFIIEIDKPLISYKQLAGPVKGTTRGAGVYSICYERTNHLTLLRDTCCFSVSVVCDSAAVFCQKDTIVNADPLTCLAKVSWNEPFQGFADSIKITNGAAGSSQLRLKGMYKGNAYYLSDSSFKWDIAKKITTGLGGHLVTITDADENAFIYNRFRQADNYGPWIGLYNTGAPGSFAWVTGEPVSYTNWNSGEPNNHNGSATIITEPYVHIMGYDQLNRWNDMLDIPLQFIAEFEKPKYVFRQTAGPVNGSAQKPGIYTVCYERLNRVTNEKDTCCFAIRVNCSATTNQPGNGGDPDTQVQYFGVKIYPNPTTTSFSLHLQSDNDKDPVSLRVFDLYGKLMETRDGLNANSTLTLGANYKRGVYIAQVLQRNRKFNFKLFKQ